MSQFFYNLSCFRAIVNYIRFTQYMNKECRADEFMDKTVCYHYESVT